jgi:hypothetical protein
VPLYSSVAPVLKGAVPIPPPNAKPAVCVPAPEELFLEVDKAPPDDQAAALNPANLKA